MNDICAFFTILPAKVIRDKKKDEEQQREQVKSKREQVCPFNK